ncbi:Golgi apparatus protein 1b isoform X1 [Tachysurus ichikawai]
MLKESKADIFVDPVLHTACALDLKHQCAAIPPGRGRQMSCLMEALQDKRVRLQPECKKRLQDRIDMWSYAAKVSPCHHIYIYYNPELQTKTFYTVEEAELSERKERPSHRENISMLI